MLRNLAGVSFNEYRILQRLSEVGTPLRSVDLVHQLCLSPATVARSADRLVKYDWAARLSDPKDRKAVFIAATEAGLKKQKTLGDSIDSLARNYLWKNLNQAQRHVIAQVGHVVIARLQEQEEAERIAALSLLQPID
ncbi:MAG: MarR family transcriptional regulator, partial [Coriobacteriales bacterium]|jgi:DNA-binding MarR family transcriptional regulator|nr:MarR family transcriptional regulator [Coriobacteriales bacterium]